MIYATVALGFLAAATTSVAAEESTGRALSGFEFGKFSAGKGFKSDDKFEKKKKAGVKFSSDGNEGDEGNEGFKFFKSGGLNNHDEGNEGFEGDEGSGIEDVGNNKGPNKSKKGLFDHNEGDEGDEGSDVGSIRKGGTTNSAKCVAVVSASAWSASRDAHVSAVADAFAIFCHEKWGTLYHPKDVEGIYEATGRAAADAMASAAAKCVSHGNAFGCAGAKAQAAAWASATAEAHAKAWAAAFSGCKCKKPDIALQTEAGIEVAANTFIQLSADVYASAEVEVCVKGTQVSSAAAFTKCWARAYATVWTKASALALITARCFKSQAGIVAAEAVTGASYTLIEDCSAKDGAKGNAGSSNGGGAQAGAEELDLEEPHPGH